MQITEKKDHETTIFSRCLNPVRVNDKYYPCNQCPLCRRKRMLEWKIRGVHELQTHKQKAIFITLTYNHKSLPRTGENDRRIIKRVPKDAGGNLNPDDMTLFLKRLRKYINKKHKERKIKYIYCGEYGTKRWRPHYHAIIYNIDTSEITEKELKKLWKKGKVDLSQEPITEKAIQYILGYTSKKILDRYTMQKEYIKKGRKPPFMRQSQGIGKQWALQNKEKVCNLKITMFGFEQPIPRAYIKFIKKTEGVVIKQKEIIKEYHRNRRCETKSKTNYIIIDNPFGEYTKKIRENQIKRIYQKLKEAEENIQNPEYFETIQEIQKTIKEMYKNEKTKIIKWNLYQKYKKNPNEFWTPIKKIKYEKIEPTDEILETREKNKKEHINTTSHSDAYIEEERKKAKYKVEILMKGIYGKRTKMEEMQEFYQEKI